MMQDARRRKEEYGVLEVPSDTVLVPTRWLTRRVAVGTESIVLRHRRGRGFDARDAAPE